MLLEEGLENVFARHHRLAEGTRRGGEGVGARALRPRAQVALRHRQRHHGAGRRQRRRGHRHRVPPLQPGARRRARADGRAGSSASATSAISTSSCCSAASPARRWRCATSGMKITPGSGVAAAQEYWRSTRQAAAEAGPAAPRARTRSRPRRRPRRRRRRARRDEPHPLRAGPPAAAAERAGGAGLAAGDVREGARERGGLRLPRSGGRRRAGRQGAGPAQRDPGPARARLARRAARRSRSGSTGSTPTTCTATWWTWWSRPATGSTRC